MNAQTSALVGDVQVDEQTRKAMLVRRGLLGLIPCMVIGVLLWLLCGGPEYLVTHTGRDPMTIAVCGFMLGLFAHAILLALQDKRRMSKMGELERPQFEEGRFVEVHEDVCRQSQVTHNRMADARKDALAFWESDTPL